MSPVMSSSKARAPAWCAQFVLYEVLSSYPEIDAAFEMNSFRASDEEAVEVCARAQMKTSHL